LKTSELPTSFGDLRFCDETRLNIPVLMLIAFAHDFPAELTLRFD
jgi:hypothetical protein